MKLSNEQTAVLARINNIKTGYQPLSVSFGSGIRLATARALEGAGLVRLTIERQRDRRPHARARGRLMRIYVLTITEAGRAALRTAV